MKRRLIDLLYNFYWVEPGRIARSAQPYIGFWTRYLSGNGIAAIINLRGRHDGWHWWKREVKVCQQLNIQHFDRALNSRRLPGRDRLLALVNAFDAAPKPVMVKCSGGQDRTSFVSALFLIHLHGWQAFDRAMGQFARFPYLHFPKAHQRWLKLFFAYAREVGGNKPVAHWIRDDYSAAAFANWLKANGHGGTYKGVFRDAGWKEQQAGPAPGLKAD